MEGVGNVKYWSEEAIDPPRNPSTFPQSSFKRHIKNILRRNVG